MGQRRHSKSKGLSFFLWKKETKIINWEQDFFVNHRSVLAVKTVDFVSGRVSYLVLRGCWCNSIVLNVNAPSEKTDDSKYSFYEELEKVFFLPIS